MNYGTNMKLTDEDRMDLWELYQKVWGGQLTHYNLSPIRLVRPFHEVPASVLVNTVPLPAAPGLPAAPALETEKRRKKGGKR